MHVPFTQLISEGPYQVGGTHERVDWRKREINFTVQVGVGQPDTVFRYRMVEQRWWQSWSATEDGYIGVYTRTHGWRFLRVRLAEEPKTAFMLDPAAMGNNFMEWEMAAVAVQPYWAKRIETSQWKNDGEGDGGIPHTPWDELEELIEDILEGLIPGISNLIPGMHIGEGSIVIPNRGSETTWPKFLVSSPGRAWIEDGPGGRMVELPLLTPQDGYVLVDTDPTARSLTAATDPVDPLFFRIARNSQLLDFLLHDITHSTLPVWRRFNGRFTTPWPAKSVCRIKVRHSNAGGSITAFMPQRFNMAFA
ncbi:hypothetical protein PXH78_26980 [Mycolicibacterium smegmatis]|uniref:hypothetical protein n=1 Tax=Mycolicibacterium smegmatis TaxID=1772 RepID=UPI001CC022EF|nr:hypothetical protein [Mycolicibacterium smegmatis]MDF1902757.1 hypothetical protein [Mycolicibacterium smegmatis]MDF1909033.1 hypothetical protein [Mycolicibacterium smegmatis]MDF1921252.1 hypothetical protein [Mycolicibacterium smegmatis]MDF1927517.1 hypothetical protein [Mycolicibacterium smegmatis]